MYKICTDEQKLRITQLVSDLNYHTEMYDKGIELISDREWDNMLFELVELENKTGYIIEQSPTQKVHFETVNKLNKIKHNHLMLSLDKTKEIEDIVSFIGDKECIAMCKMDGLTCSLKYENGVLVSAETRGDGEIGEDVLHNAKVIQNIPKYVSYKDTLIVDGEVICDTAFFEKNLKNDYKNPRNYAAGAIRRLDSKENKDAGLSFIAWDIIKGFNDEKKLSQKLDLLERYGFTTVPYTEVIDVEKNIESIKQSALTFDYPIDGVVFKYDDIEYYKSLGNTSHHFRGGYAFKFYDEEVDTRLLNIEWSLGRTGVLTPVAVFESIELEGTIVERASLHNVSVMKETMGECCFGGQHIKVVKKNQIIPQIVWADKKDYGDVISHGGYTVDGFSGVMLCPVCGGGTSIEVSDSGVENLVCNNPLCDGKLVQKLTHYCSKEKGMDIRGLSEQTIEKLIDWGWIGNIREIYSLSTFEREWQNKSGFGEKSVSNILTAIEVSKRTNLEKFISALGIPLVGRRMAKEISKKCDGNWQKFRNLVEDTSFSFSEWDGFGFEMNYAIKNFNYIEADELAELLTFELPETPSEAVLFATSATFCVTGKLKSFKNRNALKDYIESIGGRVVGSMSSKVDYLINNDTESTTSKNKYAKDNNIPILSEQDLLACSGDKAPSPLAL